VKRPKIEKFPVKFPVSREFGLETGSIRTVSSATELVSMVKKSAGGRFVMASSVMVTEEDLRESRCAEGGAGPPGITDNPNHPPGRARPRPDDPYHSTAARERRGRCLSAPSSAPPPALVGLRGAAVVRRDGAPLHP